jgi:1-acyl-sn-glycerol-3-phosphate acyltransferase
MTVLWSLLVVDPLIILSTFLCGFVSLVLALFGPRARAAQIKVERAWARSILFFGGVQVEVEGLERIDPSGHYVFIANHLSYIDTPVVLSLPFHFRFLAKKGLFQIPLLGWHLKTAGHISVPLTDPRASIRALSGASALIGSEGISVWFFPEGGRSADGILREFKGGAAYIAIKAKVPLVPVALLGPRQILPMGSIIVRRGRVKLRIGEPIPTAGMTLKDRDTLSEAARAQVTRMLE